MLKNEQNLSWVANEFEKWLDIANVAQRHAPMGVAQSQGPRPEGPRPRGQRPKGPKAPAMA